MKIRDKKGDEDNDILIRLGIGLIALAIIVGGIILIKYWGSNMIDYVRSMRYG